MSPPVRVALALGAVSLAALSLAGCGGGTVPVKGRLTQGGKPLEVSPTDRFQLRFYPVREQQADKDTPAPSFNATVEPDGAFTVPGPKGGGIPPGKYKVVINWSKDYSPDSKDKLGGIFSEERSQIVREVTGSEEIEIDVQRPQG